MKKSSHIFEFAPHEFWIIVETGIQAGQTHAPAIRTGASAAADPYAEQPRMKAAVAIRQYFGDNRQRFEDAMIRFTALMDLYGKGVLKPWIRSSENCDDASDIHPAVVHVAGHLQPSKTGKFPSRKFLAAVQRTASESYGDLSNWPESAHQTYSASGI